MPWWLIVIGVIILGVLLDHFLTEKKTREEAKNPFRSIIEAGARRNEEELTRLQPDDEAIAQRVKKLFYSAAFHESRNVTAFQNILKELVQTRKEVLNSGGWERLNLIMQRTKYLCGNDMVGFREYLNIVLFSDTETDAAH